MGGPLKPAIKQRPHTQLESPQKLDDTSMLPSPKSQFLRAESEPRSMSGSAFEDSRQQLTPLRKENLQNLPVRSRTQVVINEV